MPWISPPLSNEYNDLMSGFNTSRVNALVTGSVGPHSMVAVCGHEFLASVRTSTIQRQGMQHHHAAQHASPHQPPTSERPESRSHRYLPSSFIPSRAPPAPAAPRQHHAICHCVSQSITRHRRAIQIQPTSSPKSSSSMRRATHSTELSAPPHRLTELESMPEPTRQAVRHSTGNHLSTARLIACCAPWGRKVDRAMQHE